MAAGIAIVLKHNLSATSIATHHTDGRVELGAFESPAKEEGAVRFAAGLRDTLRRTVTSNGINQWR